MKPQPAPSDTDTERFDNAVRKLFTVSKEEMQRREAEWQRLQSKKHPKNRDALVFPFQFFDSRLGRKDRRVAGDDKGPRCFVRCLLRVIPHQFPDADCPFQIVNDS
jgi:hypothetical protein